MILDFVIFYLVFWWVMGILYKDNKIHTKLENLAIWIGQRTFIGGLVQSLSQCKFCIENHTMVILSTGYYFLYEQDIRVFWCIIIFTAINSWLREFMK